MTRARLKRVEKLEQAMVPTAEAWSGKAHQIICESEEDCATKEAALRASPAWEEGDRLTVWRVVDPPARRP